MPRGTAAAWSGWRASSWTGPCPRPKDPRRRPAAWSDATAIFRPPAGERGRGVWEFTAPLPEPWLVHVPVGPVFLKQLDQWRWLAAITPRGARMLSLFAHSGAATLALAAAGAEVVHVDASKPATALARRNATASGLDAAPIRWLCEDARTFVTREVRRGARYDGVVLDPPSWGHGPKGQAFSIDRDLAPLLADLSKIVGPRHKGPILLTCHSPRWHHRRLHDTLAEMFGGAIESERLACRDAGGRPLLLGDFARSHPAS